MPIHDKNSPRSEYRGNMSQHNLKAVYDKPAANIILTGIKLKAFPPQSASR